MNTPPVVGRSLRLTFAYDERGLHLAQAVRRTKPALQGYDPSGEPPAGAVVVELRSADRRTLHRRVLHDPIPQTVELTTEDGRLYREHTPLPRGAFVAVVPDLDDAADVVVSAGPGVSLAQPAFTRLRRAGAGPVELGRFRMPRGL